VSGAFVIRLKNLEILEIKMLEKMVRFRVDEELLERMEWCRGRVSGHLEDDVSKSAFYRYMFKKVIVVLERLIEEKDRAILEKISL